MNSYLPKATHVAVREGKILGVGNLDQLSGWGEHTLDTRFADKVLMPGFVEGHCHAPEGQIWNYTYLGYFERYDPEGNLHPNSTTWTRYWSDFGRLTKVWMIRKNRFLPGASTLSTITRNA